MCEASGCLRFHRRKLSPYQQKGYAINRVRETVCAICHESDMNFCAGLAATW